ncbi:hypothetical protein PRABACTJOHN_04459 [Parabacteroides johnsonii DSM 18315]|uniref:Uncharacterized protein n=1 Tax=Parabacteroides johnsonii DSM 18315 TaxID=537006 RepID=B7BHB0_9BACT|nr:hypothetical protein PRABACTJOHN_04459 [Parabacteroides johnsonii DSM 18315]
MRCAVRGVPHFFYICSQSDILLRKITVDSAVSITLSAGMN